MDALFQGSLVAVALAAFVPTFIGASLLRAKGMAGLFALVAVVSVVVLLFSKFQDMGLAVGVVCAFAGLLIGGRVSDMRELRRQKLKAEQEKRQRDAAWR